MANKKVFTDESLATFVDEIKAYTDEAVSTKADVSHSHNDIYYTELEINEKIDKINAEFNEIKEAKADWKQNDSSSIDYIKNRPFYETDPVETVIAEGTIPAGQMLSTSASVQFLTLGEKYTVIFDSITYSDLICVDVMGLAGLGSADMSYDDYPFALAVQNGTAMAFAGDEDSHLIKIIKYVSEVTQLERKFIADHLEPLAGEKVKGKVYIIDEEEVVAANGAEVFNDYNKNVATGRYSHAEGSDTKATGDYSHAEGVQTIASGHYSHAEGVLTTASGSTSHAEGTQNIASGFVSHAEGRNTEATNTCAHAEGFGTKATGEYSHAEGDNAIASGQGAHAEGYSAVASGRYSHAEGSSTIAASPRQHVQGRYNIEDAESKYAHIVGNGDSNSTRSNAHTLDWDGNAWYAGNVYVGGTSQDDENAIALAKENHNHSYDTLIDSPVKVHFPFKGLDTGDCTIIETKNHVMMIDCGIKECRAELLNYMLNNNITKIDYFVITHYHGDHTGNTVSIPYLIDDSRIDTSSIQFLLPHGLIDYNKFVGHDMSYDNDNFPTGKGYDDWFRNYFDTNNISYRHPIENEKLIIDDCTFTFNNLTESYFDIYYNSTDDMVNEDTKKTRYNNFSMVVQMTHRNNKFLFAADLEYTAESLIYPLIESPNVLKIQHHALNNTCDINFTKKLSPKYSVVMEYATNIAGDTMRRDTFNKARLTGTVFSSNLNGDIVITSDMYGLHAWSENGSANEAHYRTLDSAVGLKQGDDLDTIMEVGEYFSRNASFTKTLVHCPFNDSGFKLIVERMTPAYENAIRQTMVTSNRPDAEVLTRCYYKKWYPWTSQTPLSEGFIIPSGANLNDYIDNLTYCTTSAAISQSLINAPSDLDSVIKLINHRITESTIKQIILVGSVTPQCFYVRNLNIGDSSLNTPWYKFVGGADGKYNFDGRIITSNNIYTNNKTSIDDGKDGAIISNSGNIHLQGTSPSIQFYEDETTTRTSSIISSDDNMYFSGATAYYFDENLRSDKGVYTYGKRKMDDGKCGVVLYDGVIDIVGGGPTVTAPTIRFYKKDSTSPDARVNLDSNDTMNFIGASGGYTFDNVITVDASVMAKYSFYSGNKTGLSDGKTGIVVGDNGNLYMQGSSKPQIFFYTGTEISSSGYLGMSNNDHMHFGGAVQYDFDNDITLPSRIYFGYQKPTTQSGILTTWKDDANHYALTRGSDGLTCSVGWVGSSSYATVLQIQGRTCKMTNSSGTSTLSDERLKKDFTKLDKWESFYNALEPCAFKMKGGTSGRYHMGFKAQQVEQALLENELTTQDFGGFIKMAYQPNIDDPEGNAVYEEAGIKEGDDEYGLIYTEFVALNTHMIKKLKEEINELKGEIECLKNQLA